MLVHQVFENLFLLYAEIFLSRLGKNIMNTSFFLTDDHLVKIKEWQV